ncbi:TetR/AcrR family transcriptional regulator [Bailinhaonella thermotolerans]|uniref:TetR/AcrR family transcriptional regulator n=1 Tax=Bailinhaonella thermotolerans TaxID=1070861 RepID=A0A3A4ARZ3_9ACTN|nr:TetR/AcrR family transcriptional regulator [Bailinhaonella thermotolerans]RJL31951.1 TetR/AcrR family transcriptional regulator [Bailinhaonella thermotolerans]
MADDNEAGDFLWRRLERGARAPRVQLTHAQIAEAAIEMADAEGLDAVSMRKLADRLGVATMSLYRYVRSKDELLELMVDAAYEQVEIPEGADWRETLRARAWATRATYLRHPWLVRLGEPLTPAVTASADRLLATLDSTGLDADTKMVVLRTVRSYVNGIIAGEIELAELLRREGVSDMDELRHAYAPRMRWLLESGRYPAYRDYIRHGRRKDDTVWQFELGLECVLDGLATRLGI